ncbi:MAG: hypothetical protein ACLTNO_11275 [Blautia sp.]
MSDRIVVMNKGVFEQIGTPDEIYNHPETSYVATFVGSANIIKGRVDRVVEDNAVVFTCGGTALVDLNWAKVIPQEEVTMAAQKHRTG